MALGDIAGNLLNKAAGGATKAVTSTVSGAVSNVAKSALNSLGPGANAALFGNAVMNATSGLDYRARLRPKAATVYGTTGMLQPLNRTNGLIWPFTPSISIQQQVTYSNYSATHSNQDFHAYQSTPSMSFSCNGIFTVQTYEEHQYCMAAIHFLRTVTKMHTGVNDPNRGTPPPILLFSAYGQSMFNDLPVIVTSFSFDLGNEIDYVHFDNAWLPARFSINVGMTVQRSPSDLRNKFDLEKFRTGQLLKDKGWF